MKIYRNIDNFKIRKPIVTIGTFDGVHLGHQKILNFLKSEAQRLEGEEVLLTFYPHPRQVLNPNSSQLKLINTLDEKIETLKKIGIKHLIIYPFTKSFANLTSCEFIGEILVQKIGIKHLVVGYDHRFGRDREGDIATLSKCTKPYNFNVIKVDALVTDNVKISSTKIRNAINKGNIELANYYLSYDFAISGKVIEGDKIGQKFGFPTANIFISNKNKIIPANGVYAVEVLIHNKKYYGMLNIGIRPTINSTGKRSIEVNIFHFNKNIYNQDIIIKLKFRVRDEIKFKNTELLKKQLELDRKTVLKKLDSLSLYTPYTSK